MHAVNQMLWVWRGERCLVIYDFVTSFKVEKKKVSVGDVLFWVLLPLSQSWSSGLRVSFAFFWFGSTVKKFIFYSIFIFWSDQIGLSLFFTTNIHGLVKKLLLIIFIFFIDISLCTDPMHKSPFFHFEESLSIDNIWWMLLWTLAGIIILCVR